MTTDLAKILHNEKLEISNEKKIDFHVHVTPPEIIDDWQKYAETEPYFAILSKSPRNKFAAAEDVAAELEKAGFSRAVIFGFGFRDMGLCRMVNDYVSEAAARFPEKYIGFMSIPPGAKGSEIEKEIDRCYSAGLKGVGEIFPEEQHFDISEERDTRALAAACAERNIPVMVHINEPVGHKYPGKNTIELRKIERFIENSGNLRIVLAHWGGGLLFYEAMPELKEKFRNVYYDTAATPFLYSNTIYNAALALGLCDKIIFGSDFPLLPVSRYLPALDTLPPRERAMILGGNAERLLSG